MTKLVSTGGKTTTIRPRCGARPQSAASPFYYHIVTLLSVALLVVTPSASSASGGGDSTLPPPPDLDADFLEEVKYAMDASLVVQFPQDVPGSEVIEITDTVNNDAGGAITNSTNTTATATATTTDRVYELLNHPEYESVILYQNEPDQMAILKQQQKKDENGGNNGGSSCVCYLAFRGTTQTVEDWLQDFDVREDYIAPEGYDIPSAGWKFGSNNNEEKNDDFCVARKGFTNFLKRDNWKRAREDLITCLENNNDEGSNNDNNNNNDNDIDNNRCELVITGHSKGGAQALVAYVDLHDLIAAVDAQGTTSISSAKVITFGQIPVIDSGCPYIDSENVYRFVNTIYNYGGNIVLDQFDRMNMLMFDLVPFSPSMIWGDHYGYGLLLGPAASDNGDGVDASSSSDGNTNVKYFAWNEHTIFDYDDDSTITQANISIPSRVVIGNNTDVRAHDVSPSMSNHSYWNRIKSVQAVGVEQTTTTTTTMAVNTDGFAGDAPCDPYFYEACESMVCSEIVIAAQNNATTSSGIINRPSRESKPSWKCADGPAPPKTHSSSAVSVIPYGYWPLVIVALSVCATTITATL